MQVFLSFSHSWPASLDFVMSFIFICILFIFCFSGKGLTIVVSVIEGSFGQNAEKAETAKKLIVELLKKEKLKGFAEVIVSKDVSEGMSYLCVNFSCVN